jgi:hypothetical protein
VAYKIPLPPGEAWHVPPGFFPFSETEPLHIVDRTGHVVLATGKHDVAREVVRFWRYAPLVAKAGSERLTL